jgi:hypothetical protein
VLHAGTPEWLDLGRFLAHRDVPTVLLGSSEQLARAKSHGVGTVHLLMPVEAAEIAEAAELVIGPASARGLPDVIDLGLVKIDLRSRVVEIENRRVDLPPKVRDPGGAFASARTAGQVGGDGAQAVAGLLGDPGRRRPCSRLSPSKADRRPRSCQSSHRHSPRLWLRAHLGASKG